MPRKTLLFALIPLVFLSACGQPAPVVSVPPAEWFEPAAEPAPPAGDTDADVAGFIVKLVDWGRANADKLRKLRDWREGVTE